MKRVIVLATVAAVLVLMVALGAVAGCSSESAQKPDKPASTSGEPAAEPGSESPVDGEELIADKCGGCHDTMRIYMPSYANEPAGGADWADVVKRMRETHGAVLTDSEVASVVDHLVTRTPTEAEALVKEKCTGCHDTARIYDAAQGDAQWPQVITRMKDAHGLTLTEEEQATILDFLEK